MTFINALRSKTAATMGGLGMIALSFTGCNNESKELTTQEIKDRHGFHEVGQLEDGSLYGRHGAANYLLDFEGNIVSAGFHEITPNDSGYTAKVGSITIHLDNEKAVKKVDYKMASREILNKEKHKLSNGAEYIKDGSTILLVNKEGHPISEGFHSITPTDNGYTANIGSSTYLLDEKGKTISEGFHFITPNDSGYTAKVGASRFHLDKSGKTIKKI